MSTIACKHCGGTTINYQEHGPHIGAYCANCNKFIKWVSKKEAGSNVKSVTCNNVNISENTSSAKQTMQEHLLDLAQGEANVQLQRTGAGTLVMRTQGKTYMLYNTKDFTEQKRFIITCGTNAIELGVGETVEIHIV